MNVGRHYYVTISNPRACELARCAQIVMLLLLLVASTRSAHAQSGACQETDYKILSPSAIAVRCTSAVDAAGRTATITDVTQNVSKKFDPYSYVGAKSWLLLVASPSSAPFAFSS